MPFKSEKQRRYLWANEPEIARDWTDTYGSRVKKFDGGALYNTLENQGITSINNPLSSLQQGYARHIDQNALLEQALTDNRITEDQYKRMGGYNVLQNAPSYGFIKPTAGDVGIASFGYNTAKSIADMFADNPRGYGDIGYLDSIAKNYQGAKEGLQGDELELYSSIINPRSAYIDDANYIPRNTMTAGIDPHNFEFGNQWQTAEDESSKWNWGNVGEGIGTLFALANETMPWSWAKRGWDALTSGFSGQRTPRDPGFGRGLSGNVSWAGQRYDKQYGTGAYKDKKIQDWHKKYGHMKYKTKKMQEKQAFMKQEADRIAKEKAKQREQTIKSYANWQSPSGRDHAGTSGIGSAAAKSGPAGGSIGASRFR